MTDSYFVGTIARVHNLWRFGGASSDINLRPSAPSPSTTLSSSSPSSHSKTPTSNKRTSRSSNKYLARLAAREAADNQGLQASDKPQERVGMMVSLDHTYAIFSSVPPFAFIRYPKGQKKTKKKGTRSIIQHDDLTPQVVDQQDILPPPALRPRRRMDVQRDGESLVRTGEGTGAAADME